MEKVLVTGAGGFIGSHLVKYLKEKGHFVRGVDIKRPEFEDSHADEFLLLDLRIKRNAMRAVEGMDWVFGLAADMGGIAFISKYHYRILKNNALININTIDAAVKYGVKKYLFSSSACIYPNYKQTKTDSEPLKEEDAFPADPQDAYGWEKLLTEILLQKAGKQFGMDYRIVRFHNIYGPKGTYDGGREKAPAAFCRKMAYAKLLGHKELEMWGDGKQTRSFCYINDCTKGLYKIIKAPIHVPINLGRDDMINMNDMMEMIGRKANYNVGVKHIEGPEGVRGRNSDNSFCRKMLQWEPEIDMETGMKITYDWIEEQVKKELQ